MTDASSKLAEKATYCRPNDNKRPELVGLPDATTSQICPIDKTKGADEVVNAYPDGWFVRVMFDELLDPNIEALVDTTTGMPCDTTAPDKTCSGTIAAAHPVDLKCHSVVDGALTSVSYDGYYSPAGNAVTWPLGPSLVIKPNAPTAIATNTECEVTLNGNITDKDGNPVPMDERGPYKFKIAPITSIAMDPPADDPDYKAPIDALTIFLDNPYVQFNTTVDPNSICPDEDGDGNCDNDSVFSLADVAHPTEGPGRCDKTLKPCGSMADCDTAGGDTLCGKGICGSTTATGSSTPCNKAADCKGTDDTCDTMYAYNYVPYGATDTEFGMGPIEPVETEHKYIFSFTAGAKLKDRCGATTVLPTPTADNLLLAHFITNKFDFNKASIATGETASAMKRLTYTWNNVLTGSDFTTGSPSYTAATGQAIAVGDIQAGGAAISPVMSTTGSTPAFTVAPLPKKLTAACAADGSGCTTADLALGELLIVSPGADGQVMLQGHLQMNTEYTATIKAGTIIKDFYGKPYTQTSDSVIKWKTAPAIAVTSIGVRQPGTLVNIADKGTITLPTPTTTVDIRIGFNASMDAKTLDASEVSIEAADTDTPPPPTLSVVSASGCGNYVSAAGQDLYAGDNRMGWIGSCSLRVRGLYKPGNYKFTIKKDASFKDIFGTVYTQAADQSITFTIKDAPAPVQCL